MLHSRWQPAVSNKSIHADSNLLGCYAVAAASELAASAYSAEVAYGTPSLRQDGLHVGVVLASTISAFDSLWMGKRGESKPPAASRSQAQMGLRKRRRING